ncbi:MAG: alpha/beta hydrolase [Clostridia bacterium]|nr:alpha/beta hydrolase [Clostridia bacterium]
MENNNKNTRSILIAAGVAAVTAVAAGAVHHLIAKSLMDVAMDRKGPKAMSPKNMEKLMGTGELAAVMDVVAEAAAELEQQEMETVEIDAFDGTRLVGHWYPCENAKRCIVAMHGWRSAWSQDFGIISKFWHEQGCSILFAEQRGQGNSGGDYMGFGLLERYDCLEWTKWVDANTKDLPIYLCGLSMGATTVLMTAGFDLPERVHGIMADCGFTSPHAIWKHVVQKNLHIPYRLYKAAASDLYKKKLRVDSKEYSCPEALKKCKVPVLFIHGTDDRFVPISHTYENYKACAAEKRLLVVPGADHCLSYFTDEATYAEHTLRFWKDYDEKLPEPVTEE